MKVELTQSEFEELSAYFDGCLDGQEAARIERLIATADAWKQAYEELQALDEAMDTVTTPPAPAGLAARIIAASRNQQRRPGLVIRLVRVLAPMAAAAAAILLVISIYTKFHTQTSPEIASNPQAEKAAVDELVIENLDFFKSYESLDAIANNEAVVDAATLSAIDRLETPKGT